MCENCFIWISKMALPANLKNLPYTSAKLGMSVSAYVPNYVILSKIARFIQYALHSPRWRQRPWGKWPDTSAFVIFELSMSVLVHKPNLFQIGQQMPVL